jgi:hypothetical protein
VDRSDFWVKALEGETVNSQLHSDLLAVMAAVYEPGGFVCSVPRPDAENAEYGAVSFFLDGRRVKYRAAKVTPTKNGLFAVAWKRAGDGSTVPFSGDDPFDLLAVSTREGSRFGQFVFPRPALIEHDIVSSEGRGGKRGFRVYPPWVTVESRQAGRTQAWQAEYFLAIDGADLDFERARLLCCR